MFIVTAGLLRDNHSKEKVNLNLFGTNLVKKLGALGLSSPHPDGTAMLVGTWQTKTV